MKTRNFSTLAELKAHLRSEFGLSDQQADGVIDLAIEYVGKLMEAVCVSR